MRLARSWAVISVIHMAITGFGGVFGSVAFEEGEEYFRFRYRFLFALLFGGFVLSGLFALMSRSGVNPLDPTFVSVVTGHSLASGVLLLLLRGHRERFHAIAWIYAVACFGDFLASLVYVTVDEFRLVWFVTNLAGVYIILGRPAGVAATVFTLVSVEVVNQHLATPFSGNAMTTFNFSLVYESVFFYVYSGRSHSFYLRLVESNIQLKEMADRDPLTGLMNARAYYAVCDRLIRAAQRSGAPFAVLFVDLDHFKTINDTHGHEAGDVVLKAVAACLAASSRESDVVGRIGGEEFSIFLPDTPLAGALLLGEKLRADIEALMPNIGAASLRVTASIGAASSQPRHAAIADIQREADAAMYQAKAAGRNRVTSLA
jgi:diguanylate cyclase (GGDEF)-like protein